MLTPQSFVIMLTHHSFVIILTNQYQSSVIMHFNYTLSCTLIICSVSRPTKKLHACVMKRKICKESWNMKQHMSITQPVTVLNPSRVCVLPPWPVHDFCVTVWRLTINPSAEKQCIAAPHPACKKPLITFLRLVRTRHNCFFSFFFLLCFHTFQFPLLENKLILTRFTKVMHTNSLVLKLL